MMQDQTGKYEYVTTLSTIVLEKISDIKSYLQQVDRSRNDKPLDSEIYDNTVNYIQHSYTVGVVQSLKRSNKFWVQLSPDLKNNLVFALLDVYY